MLPTFIFQTAINLEKNGAKSSKSPEEKVSPCLFNYENTISKKMMIDT